MRFSLFVGAALAVAVATLSCGGGSSNPTTPTTPTTNSVTVTIVGPTGKVAFQPNPVTGVNAGDTITFKNSDAMMFTHHIVMDDGSADLGVLPPGASKAFTLKNNSTNFHCMNHPSMVGAINGTPPEPPPCNNPGYCG